MNRWIRLVAGLGVLTLALAACGSSSSSTSDTKPKATTTTTADVEASLVGCKAGPPDPGTKASTPRMSVDPCEGLTDQQTVTVYAAGFTAGKTVGINQCSTETDDTGSGCNLEGLKTMKIGADGTASSDYTVVKGPFGKDNVVCSPPTQCLLSVGELAAGDVERADAVDINFAG
jgi:Neocarzinostatin family